jgi:hypothetical protein
MSHSISGAFTKEKRDELYTPKILVDVIQPFIQQIDDGFASNNHEVKIWLPFDTEDSEYAYMCREHKYKYIASHISDGRDFFKWEPDPSEYNLILSNPPFSRKLDVFKRCNKLGKDWIMLMNMMAINYMEIGSYFADNPVQFIIPDKRISFNGNPSSFCSGYVCKLNYLYSPIDHCESQLIFVHAPHCNSGKDFIPSRMYKG